MNKIKAPVDFVDYLIIERRTTALVNEGFDNDAANKIAEEERLNTQFVRYRLIDYTILDRKDGAK